MNINPDIMRFQHGVAYHELVGRRTGQSTARVLRGIAHALEKPGCKVRVKDHAAGHKQSQDFANNLCFLALGILSPFKEQWVKAGVEYHDGEYFLSLTNTHIQPLTKPTMEIYVY